MNYFAQFSRDPATRVRHMSNRALEEEFNVTLHKIQFQRSVVAGLHRLIGGRQSPLQTTLEYHLVKVQRKQMWLDFLMREAERRGMRSYVPDDSDVRTLVAEELDE